MNPSARTQHPLDRDAFSFGEVDHELQIFLAAREMVWP